MEFLRCQVSVREADNAKDLASAPDQQALSEPDQATRAVYELTAVVAHIEDDSVDKDARKKPNTRQAASQSRNEAESAEGHVIAHIRVCSHLFFPKCDFASARRYL